MLPVVSVIIPTYKHADYVLETLGSVFAQTFPDYEIVVVNDGSPDDSAARLRPLAEAGEIRYFEQPNAGQAAARNRGLAEARGEFVAFLDDDDLWPPDKLAWQVAALRTNPAWGMVAGLCGQLGADGARREPDGADGAVRMLPVEATFQECPINTPGQVLIRRTALEAVGGFDPAIWGSDDLDLWMRLAAHGPAALVERCALYYRLHTTNASHASGRMFWNAVRTVRKNLPLVPRDRRAAARRNALRNIYMYSGTRVVHAARGGTSLARRHALEVLAYLALPMLRDPDLAKMVGRDLLPAQLRQKLHQAKPSPAA